MRRLFAFGCSYTKYFWPTWADLLGINYDYFENWGIGGIGNQCISQRVQECHLANKFTPNDTIIVQWSSYTRHDCYLEHWQSRGSVFSENGNNRYIYTPSWLSYFFTEKGFLLNTLNNISHTQDLLSKTGCEWYMTSMNDLFSLNTDIIDQRKNVECMPQYIEYKKDLLLEKYPELELYTNKIWSYNNWIPDFRKIQSHTPNKEYTFIDDSVEPLGYKRWIDVHPSPEQFNIWIDTNCSKLFDLDKTAKIRKKVIDTVNDMKGDLLFLLFADKLFNESKNPISRLLPWWPSRLKGM